MKWHVHRLTISFIKSRRAPRMNKDDRHSRYSRRMMRFALIGGLGLLAGCGTIAAKEHSGLHSSTAHTQSSPPRQLATLPQVQIVRIKNNILTGYQLQAGGHEISVQGTITPQTKVWANGKMVSYANVPHLKVQDIVSISYQHGANHRIADLYGPWVHVHGIIQAVTPHTVTIRTTRPAMDPPGTPYTAKTLTLMLGATSQFSGTSSASLKPGRSLGAQVIGFSLEKRFIVTASIYRQKGPNQWTQVVSSHP